MIAFLLTTVCLSCAGFLLYLLLMRRASAAQQKGFLYTATLAAWIFPAFLWWQTPHIQQEKPVPFGAALLTAQPTEASLQQLCHCPAPNYGHRVQYRTHAWLNFLLDRTGLLMGLLLAAMGVVVLIGIGEWLFLRRLLTRSQTASLTLLGSTYAVLYPSKPQGVGAFWLGKAWVVWQPELEGLAPEELHAILQHELSHIRQRHTAERFVLRLLQCAWFLNPAFYLLRRELHRIGECIADGHGATALGDPARYARLLVAFAQRKTAPVVQAFSRKPLLYRRVAYLLGPRRLGRVAFIVSVAICLGMNGLLGNFAYARFVRGIAQVQAYHTVYVQHPTRDTLLYCPDCETVCEPE